MTPPNTPTPRTDAIEACPFCGNLEDNPTLAKSGAVLCPNCQARGPWDCTAFGLESGDEVPLWNIREGAKDIHKEMTSQLTKISTLERELAEAKDVLRSIRDHEVNPEDYADQYLRDHQHSELHKAINDRDQLRAVNKELRSYLDAAHYATCNEELRAKLTQIKAEIAQIYQEREHNANQALIYKAERDELRAELIEARNHEYAGELKAADQELAQLREVAGELAVACHNVISPLRPHWRETMQLAVNALAKYDNLTKGTKE